MAPPIKDEFEYYARIMDRFEQMENPERNTDIFFSREIIKVLKFEKPKVNNQEMSNIVKNSIILLLALYRKNNSDSFRNFTEIEKPQQKIIQKELLTLITA